MPKLPDQRGFYDDIRPFQRRDVRVQTEAFAPTPRQQLRTQAIWGLAFLAFLGAAAGMHLYSSSQEAKARYHAPSYWQGVSANVPAQSQPTLSH